MLNFESVLPRLKEGGRILRQGWSGGEEYVVKQDKIFDPSGQEVEVTPYFLIKVEGEGFSMWSPTPCDVLAEDWVVIE